MSYVRLTLSCPRAVGEQIVEYVLDSPLLPRGFTTMEGSGHGADFEQASLRERVRGRVDVTLVIAILHQTDLASLLEDLRSKFRTPQVHYWIEPVLDSGEFA